MGHFAVLLHASTSADSVSWARHPHSHVTYSSMAHFYQGSVVESLSTLSVPVRIHLTGRMAVTYGENLLSTVDLPGPQVALVIAILATRHQRPTSLIELADIVWNGEPPESWRSTLRGHVSRARSALRDIGIVISGGEGGISSSFPRARQWMSSRPNARCTSPRPRRDQATPKRRTFGSDGGDDRRRTGAARARPSLDRRHEKTDAWYRIRTLEVLIDLWLASGHNEQAAVNAERLVLLDPIRESGYAGLLRAHVAAGNTALALRTYERCRTTLRDELDVSPGDEIEALYESIL